MTELAASPDASSPDAEATLHALDPAIRTVWTLKLAAFVALTALAAFFYDFTHWLGGDAGLLPTGVLTLLVAGAGSLYSAVWPRLRYRYWRFALHPEELYLEHGVLNRTHTIVPLRRIQHLDVSQDVLEREFGLGRLIVHTAGSRSSDVVLPGLPLDEAEQMRDDVKRYILDDPLMEEPV